MVGTGRLAAASDPSGRVDNVPLAPETFAAMGALSAAVLDRVVHERSRAGALVCPRLGLAADFRVPGVDNREVALFVAEETAFDRIYFYGPDRPVHVSVGPEGTRQIVRMVAGPSGRRVPRIVTAGFFRERP